MIWSQSLRLELLHSAYSMCSFHLVLRIVVRSCGYASEVELVVFGSIITGLDWMGYWLCVGRELRCERAQPSMYPLHWSVLFLHFRCC